LQYSRNWLGCQFHSTFLSFFAGHSGVSCLLSLCLAALPDGGFLRKICKILADLKVICRSKNISGGLLISGRFLADLTNFAWVGFFWWIWQILALLESLLAKKTTCFSLFHALKISLYKVVVCEIISKNINILQNIFKKVNFFTLATSEIRLNPH
jgi:hypothetical protein